MINALHAQRPFGDIWPLAVAAFGVWVLHGNILTYLIDRLEVASFSFPARQDISLNALALVLSLRPEKLQDDPALMQVVIERGEAVVVEWLVSVIRIVLPLALPFCFVLIMLFHSSLLLGGLVFAGAMLDLLITVKLNTALSPRYVQLRDLEIVKGRTHFAIFADLPHYLGSWEEQAAARAAYRRQFQALTEERTQTLLHFLGFHLKRGVVINLTHLLTWTVGIWYVSQGVYQVGYLLVFLKWETLVFDFLSNYLQVQKQWMETSPAIAVFFAQLDAHHPTLPALVPEEIAVLRQGLCRVLLQRVDGMAAKPVPPLCAAVPVTFLKEEEYANAAY